MDTAGKHGSVRCHSRRVQKQACGYFKHSTRCGISSMTIRQFESNYQVPQDTIALYYLDLLAYRDISNEVAIRFQVLHQSPQMLIIKNGTTVHAASHYQVQAATISQFI